MKKHIILTLLISFCALSINAQTKRIAHRSHGGVSINYSLLESDNLGLSPDMERRMSRRYDSMQRVKLHIKDSIKRATTKDSNKTSKNKKAKQTPKKKIEEKQKKKPKKTQPLPPNNESSKSENKPNANYLLLFLVAVPVSTIAYFSRKG